MRFADYYETDFARDIRSLFGMYRSRKIDMVFRGFHKDEVAHMDTFYLKDALGKMNLTGADSLANFAMGIWAMTASDIFAYSRYPEYEASWYNATRYPKITGWNYFAAAPNWIFQAMIKQFPDEGLERRIQQLIEEEGNWIANSLARDISMVLEEEAYEGACSFLNSWLTINGEGEYFDRECFLH